MANKFLVARGKLPEWHKSYKQNSTELVEPFIAQTTGVVGPAAPGYTPAMVSHESTSAGYSKFWKRNDFFKTASGGLVYSGTAPGLKGGSLTNIWSSSTSKQYSITRTYNSSKGGYDLNITPSGGTASTYLSGSCPTCLYFELCGGGGGGSGKYPESGMRDIDGNGGAGAGAIFGILDFSVATSGFILYIGAGGSGGTFTYYDYNTTIEQRRLNAKGNEGGASYISDIAARDLGGQTYFGFKALGGKGGPVIPYNSNTGTHTCVTSPAAGGGCQRMSGIGTGTVSSTTIIPSVASGVILLGFANGAPGGVSMNNWTFGQSSNPASTGKSSMSVNLAPGTTGATKTYSAKSGGVTHPDTGSDTCGGGGASMLGIGSYHRTSGSPGYGGGGAGGFTGNSNTEGQQGGNGYFALYYDTL